MNKKILRVAAYCRVSTGDETQINSYNNQISYYSELISANPGWIMSGIFADEGISGTQTKNRREFNRMLRLCRRGKIDLILCKSISRFARNTLDCLKYVRELKALGISVQFEKENINTGEENSEFMITLYAAFAQAESESISKNITWGIEKKFREGRVSYKLDCVLGYRSGPDGKPVIVTEEAEYVRLIFDRFIAGLSMGQIAKMLTECQTRRRNGSTVWERKHVEQVLKNEKYAGLVIMQKTVTTDFITHTRVKNTGQKPQYVLHHAHEAIISEETYEKAQEMFEMRSLAFAAKKAARAKHSVDAVMTGTAQKRASFGKLLFCPYCGSSFRRVVRSYKGEKYALWRCAGRLEGGKTRCEKGASVKEEYILKQLDAIYEKQTKIFKKLSYTDIDDITDYDPYYYPWNLLIEKITIFEKESVEISMRQSNNLIL